jgi:small-conductance mechanosensitive channel
MRALGLIVVALLATPDLIDPGLPPAPSLDRATPNASLAGFVDAMKKGDPSAAAHHLDLSFLTPDEQAFAGPKLARHLYFVMDRELHVATLQASHSANGEASTPGVDTVGTIPLGARAVPIRLAKVTVTLSGPDGGPPPPSQTGWVFSQETVHSIDELYAAYGPPIGELLPQALYTHSVAGLELWQWVGLFVSFILALVFAVVLERVVLALGARMARMTAVRWDDELVEAARGPLKLLLFSSFLALGVYLLLLPAALQHGLDVFERSLVILAVAWFAFRFLTLISSVVQASVGGKPEDPRVRSLRTQIAVLRRVFNVAIWFIAAALFLMQFELVRSVGVSLLASAGIAGLVLGLAAQKSISTLLAGIQLSITQPIRIGDYVVLEGESGNVEEISLTYVIVKIWDGRRLVLPMTYFMEKPFQNWNKGDLGQLGTVTLQVDFSADVEVFRKELRRVLETEGKTFWDGKTQGIVVTETTDRTMTIRALVGAFDFGVLWDLRCLVRERLIAVLRAHPEWLPRVRTDSPRPPS